MLTIRGITESVERPASHIAGYFFYRYSIHETNVSTQQDKENPHPRLQSSDGDKKRASGSGAQAEKRSGCADGIGSCSQEIISGYRDIQTLGSEREEEL